MTTELAQVEPWYFAGWSKHISPSGLGRAVACPRSEAMPHVQNLNPFASKGTEAHRFLANVLEHGREEALSLADVCDADWLAEIDIERLPAFSPDAYSAELAIAYDPRTRTARELGRNMSRSEARKQAEDHELVGVMDIAGATDDAAVVADYKTGWGYVEAAELNWQLKSYALFLARLLGKVRALYSIVRVLDNGSIFRDSAEMDELDLLAHEDDLIAALEVRESVRNATREGRWQALPPLVEGKHCRYCPAFAFCPAKVHAINIVGQNSDVMPVELLPENAAVAWKRIRAAQKVLERYEGILREFSRQTPIPLGEGEVLAPREKKIETIVPDLARQVLEKQYGQAGMAAASAATENDPSMSKSALKAALKKFIMPTRPKDEQKITHIEKEVLTLLRTGRAINQIKRSEVCEHVPHVEAPALPEGEEVAA